MRPDQLDENRSSWLAELPPYAPLPPAAGVISADVVVVGGGLTGVSTAWHLSERFPGRRIALLEARALANGASGRNGGLVLNGIAGIEPEDPTTARRVYAATRLGIDIVENLAGRSTLPAGFSRCGVAEVYTSARSAESGQARAERYRAWGIPMQWLDGRATGVAGAHGAALDPTAATVNAAAVVRGLRPALLDRGVAIYERTPVLRIDEGNALVLHTPAATVRAAALVLATNAYTPLLGYFRSRILPLHSHVIATAPLSAAEWSAFGLAARAGFTDDRDRVAYGCRTPGHRLLFGGGGNDAYTYCPGGAPVLPASRRRSERAAAAIVRHLRGYFPGFGDVPIAHQWVGTLDVSFDRVCSIGTTGAARNVYYALGYSGHGLALAALAGRVLTELYSDNREPWSALPFYERSLPYIPREPLRWLGYHLYTRFTGRSPRRG
ncbi:MAG: NAD(P)/FAD-dependent oxidoreductase [Candidatus Binatia bacterium]